MNGNLKTDLENSGLKFSQRQILSKFTTMGVGGKAEFFVQAENISDLKLTVELAVKNDTEYFVIGKGSNLIITDDGYPGLVILNNSSDWHISAIKDIDKKNKEIAARFQNIQPADYENIQFDNLEKQSQKIIVTATSGLRITNLMNLLFREGIFGLQWFAGIPATVGGAIYMNLHGGNKYFSDLLINAKLTNGKEIKDVKSDYFQFDYDWSILHKTKETVLSADLLLYKGDVSKPQRWANEWAKIKSFQPQKSAGCIFKNLCKEDQLKYNLPTSSSGYLIDKVLGLKGKRIGGAIISDKHAAFIENTGKATAKDVIELIDFIKDSAKSKLGLELQTEVQIIGIQ